MINFEAFFKVTYGLYIVGAGKENENNGFISNAVFQVTAEPPQFAVCCNKDNYTSEFITSGQVFTISVLGREASTALIGKFGYKSGRNIKKFENVNYKTGITGAPVLLDESVAYIECRLVQTFDVGTHLMFIGEAIHAEILENKGKPMTYEYYRTVKKGIAPKNAPTYIDRKKLNSSKNKMAKYKCTICGHIYDPAEGDPDSGISPGTAFEDIPDDWECPVCGSKKTDFVKIG